MMHFRRICNKNQSLMQHRLCTKIFKVITCPFLHARIEKWLTNIFDIKVKNDGINLEHIRIFLPATYSTFRLKNSQNTMLQKYTDLIFIMLPRTVSSIKLREVVVDEAPLLKKILVESAREKFSFSILGALKLQWDEKFSDSGHVPVPRLKFLFLSSTATILNPILGDR